MKPIFISYRRDDAEGQAGRLFEALREVFGAEMVFMDVATIEPGVDFRRAIEKNTASCGVLLALIGRNWLTVADAQGQRRLDDPNDFVRLETALALKRDIPVVPVLVQGATMPRPEQLPEDLRDLSFRNSVELTHARWESDVQVLIGALRKVLGAPEGTAGGGGGGRPGWLWPAVGAGVVALGMGGWFALDNSGMKEHAAEPVAPAASSVPSPAASAPVRSEPRLRRPESTARPSPQPKPSPQEPAETPAPKPAQPSAEELAAAKQREDQTRAHNDGICLTGFVWREARAGDKVCVTPDVRARSAAENQAAARTRSPNGGPYGVNTCREGYVWREAYPGDVVCVVPASRQQAANDNAQAAQRVVPLPR